MRVSPRPTLTLPRAVRAKCMHERGTRKRTAPGELSAAVVLSSGHVNASETNSKSWGRCPQAPWDSPAGGFRLGRIGCYGESRRAATASSLRRLLPKGRLRVFQKPVLKTPPVAIAAVGEWAGRRDRDGGWHASWDDGAAALGQSYIGPLDMGMPLKQLLGTLYSVRLSRHCLCLAPPLVSWLKHCLWLRSPGRRRSGWSGAARLAGAGTTGHPR